MIDFIFGEAGSGKSTYIYKWITKEAAEHPSQQYFLFVPEQNTLKAQREIIKYSECHGMLNLDVLSFQLLAYRVMQELGEAKPVVIDDVSKSILIRKAAADNADKLKVYRSKIASDGFIRQIKSVISEFYQYEVNADRLREAEDEVSLPLLKGKLSDMALIYESFQAMIRDRAAIPEELSYMLLKLMGRSKLLKDAIIVFDGYTGFTPIQTRLLEHIIPDAQRCRFAVTIPVSAAPYSRVGSKLNQGDTSDIYMLSRDTVARVCEAAELNNVPRSGETEIKHNRKRARLGIVRTADPVEEVYAAKKILRACGLRKSGVNLISCPTCGRTAYDMIPLAEELERRLEDCDKPITVAVMGCVVNGPGEARAADIGVAGGKGEGLIFRRGEILYKVPQEKLLDALLSEIEKLCGGNGEGQWHRGYRF